jgi:diaminohydroxyphosphoribosylaminopyrimidine deaminase/5-amino-6-(5-phosphoribosylamino)uracil reductase
VKRVVVGFRDPNPRVDGGGIEMLKRAGIEVRVLSRERSESVGEEEAAAAIECAQLVEYFVKRITSKNGHSSGLYDNMTGKKRMMLRAMALRQKTAGNMPSVEWLPDKNLSMDDNKENVDFLHQIHIDSRFLEAVDQSLWNHELVLLRLNNIVNKKKGAKILGERVAEILCAHVAQVLGHTALLYRPAEPPVLDLEELVGKESSV